MKNIFRIFRRDVKKIFTNSMAIILAVGVAVLPSLYAWFNIYANWDPYGNTGNMQVAVIIDDEGYSIHDIDINVGQEIRNNLNGNDAIDWQFVDKETAMQGVEAGEYYAAIEIPAGFSKSLTSIITTQFKQPQITYYANEKKNAIATKITDKVVQTVQTSVNESFVTTVINLVNKLLGTVVEQAKKDGGGLLLALDDQLQSAENSVKAIKTSVNGLEDVLQIAQDLNDALADNNLAQVLDDTGAIIDDTQSAINVAQKSVDSVVSTVDVVLDDASKKLTNTSKELRSIDNVTTEKSKKLLGDMLKTLSATQKSLETIISSLEGFDKTLPKPIKSLTTIIADLKNIDTSVSDAIRDLNRIKDGDKTVTISSVADKLDNVASVLNKAKGSYNKNVRPELSKTVGNLLTVLFDVSSLIETLQGDVPKLNNLVGSLNTAVGAGDDMLKSLNDLLDSVITELDNLSKKIKNLSESELANTVINITDQNAEELGSFIACPVIVNTEKVYGIENYGSAMAPFYSTLAIWVGGVILVAIIKTNVKNKNEIGKRVTPTQVFFGRSLIFMCFAVVQSLIICLGDLYFLKIQCYHPVKYIFAGVVGALIFDFFIYSVCVAFGEIGKAVPVVMLVIQLGGCGGTFPVDVTPTLFRTLNPFMPFTFLIEAMRECICGTYSNYYWIWLLKLCAYLAVALLIGTLVRFLLRKPILFFGKQIEKTGLF